MVNQRTNQVKKLTRQCFVASTFTQCILNTLSIQRYCIKAVVQFLLCASFCMIMNKVTLKALHITPEPYSVVKYCSE